MAKKVGVEKVIRVLREVEVLEGKGSDSCAWTTGERRDRYFQVDTERLLFTKEREFPFRRVEPD